MEAGHPAHFLDCVPWMLRDTIDKINSQSVTAMALERSAAMRKWVMRAKETREAEAEAMRGAPIHCREVMRKKNITLFAEMMAEAGHGDAALGADLRRGFDLMGDLEGPASLPRKVTYATLTPDQVRSTARDTRRAIMLSAQSARDSDMDQALYDVTMDEVDRGWLEGPLDFSDLSADATVSRRFGAQPTLMAQEW